MKIELEDIMFWMDAIRNSEDRYRTLESFWKGQLRSKRWLIDSLDQVAWHKPARIVIHGGWNGVLATMLFNSDLPIKHITSVDIDPDCKNVALTMNKRYEIEGRFTAVTADMCDYKGAADIVINTSCEHITQEQYDKWLANVPDNSIIVLQSNNYTDLDEHIRCAEDLDEFTSQSNIQPHIRDVYSHEKYERYMLIGKKKLVQV